MDGLPDGTVSTGAGVNASLVALAPEKRAETFNVTLELVFADAGFGLAPIRPGPVSFASGTALFSRSRATAPHQILVPQSAGALVV